MQGHPCCKLCDIISDIAKIWEDKLFNERKRVFNILQKNKVECNGNGIKIDESLFQTHEEQILFELIKKTANLHTNLTILLKISKALEKFFETTMVISKDKKVKENRLKLLCLTKAVIDRVFRYNSSR